MDPARHVWAEIATTQLEASDVLNLAAVSWSVKVDRDDKAATLSAIERFLYDQHRMGRRCLLVVDEAQNLPVSALEELRMLSNFQVEGRSPLQCFLVGQPQFRQILSSTGLEQLRQRVIASYHLGPMTEEETAAYVRHRLSCVGWKGDPEFTDSCMNAIFRNTGGIPRRINTLASRMLVFGFLDGLHVFSPATVDQVADEQRQELELLGCVEAPALPAHEAVATVVGDVPSGLPGRLDRLEARTARLERTLRHALRLLAAYLER